MRIVEVNRHSVESRFLKRRQPERTDFDEVIDEPCELREGAVLRAVSMKIVGNLVTDLESELRALRFNADERTMGMVQRSRVFGFQVRNALRVPTIACRPAALNREMPQLCHTIERCGAWMTARYREFGGEIFKHHEAQMARVRPEWRMSESVYTSGIINENNALAYHYDSGNFRGCWSGMIVLPHRITGGELVLPQFRVAFRFKEPSVFFFDGQSILHGVMPIQRPKMGYRYSLVYYSLQQMWRCLPPAEELQRAMEVRTVREKRRLLYSKGLATPYDVEKHK